MSTAPLLNMSQTSGRASVAIQSRPDASISRSSGNDVTAKRSAEGRSFGAELKKVTKQQEQTHKNSTDEASDPQDNIADRDDKLPSSESEDNRPSDTNHPPKDDRDTSDNEPDGQTMTENPGAINATTVQDPATSPNVKVLGLSADALSVKPVPQGPEATFVSTASDKSASAEQLAMRLTGNDPSLDVMPPYLQSGDLPANKENSVTTATTQLASLLSGTPVQVSPTSDTGASLSVPGHVGITSSGSPGGLLNTTTSPLPAQLQIGTPVNQPQWAEDVGQQLQWMANQNIQRADIRINPAHLGPIEVRIIMQHDQLNVSLSAQHAQVRDALEAALPRLREGLNLGGFTQTSVDVGQQGSNQYSGQGQAERDFNEATPMQNEGDNFLAPITEINQAALSQGLGILDHYA